MEVVELASVVLLAIGYVGVPAGGCLAFAFAVLGMPFAEGRRWYGRRFGDIWRAWRNGTVGDFEFRVGTPATLLRPAWQSLLVTVPSFVLGMGLGLISGAVTWAG